jgi:hypothetical protein
VKRSSILTCSLALALAGCGNSTSGKGGDMAPTIITQSLSFQLTNVPPLVHPNDNVNFTLTVVDGAGNTVTSYKGTVKFDSNDGTATLPADYTFTGAEGGTQMFNAKFVTPGKWALRATDSGGVAPQGSAFLICQGPAARLVKVSGDGQTGMAGSALAQPFVVQATDTGGNPISGVAITWTAASGSGSITPPSANTDNVGNASATGTLAPAGVTYTYQAAATGLVGSPVVFTSMHGPFKLTYTDPAAGGKLRLVKNAASTNTQAVLDLVVGAAPQTGYSAGFNLPLDVTKVVLNALVAGTALSAGTATTAAKAVIPVKGPLNGVLVAAQSQKGAGTGAVTTDTVLATGAVIFTIKLDLGPLATTAPGVVFDGTAGGFMLPSGGLRDKTGATVVLPSEVSIGKLAVTQ